MSFTFTIQGARPDYPALEAALSARFGSRLSCDDPPEGPWQGNHYTHVYLWGVSTRAVEIGAGDDGVSVRIMSCSCTEDHELALAAVEHFASGGRIVEPEYGESGPWEAIRGDWEGEWTTQSVESGATILPRMLAGGEIAGPLTLPGPVRDFVIGPWLAGQLEPVDASYAERLFERIRAVQYADLEEQYFRASVLELQVADDRTRSLVVWAPGVAYLFPYVELIVVHAEDYLFIPSEALFELAGDACTRLDERQALVEAIDEGPAWDALIERARVHVVQP